MRKELADYIIIAARALPAGMVFLAIGLLLIRVTGDTETWGWVPVLGYVTAYLKAAGREWNIDNEAGGPDNGGKEKQRRKGGTPVQALAGLCSAAHDDKAA